MIQMNLTEQQAGNLRALLNRVPVTGAGEAQELVIVTAILEHAMKNGSATTPKQIDLKEAAGNPPAADSNA